MRSDLARSLGLCVLSLIGYALAFAVQVLLARNLSIAEFDDYNVALAILMVASTVATLGLEKYALYLLPVLQEREDWSRTRGFLKSSAWTILVISIGLSVAIVLAVQGVWYFLDGRHRIAVSIAMGSLPAMAWGLFLVEAITAYGREWLATFFYRIAIPLGLLGGNAWWLWYRSWDSAAVAAITLGMTWWLAAIGLTLAFLHVRPRPVPQIVPRTNSRLWIRRALPMSFFSILLTIQASSGVLVLEWVYPDDALVAEYAVAQTIGTILLLIATATNRFYLPIYSLHLERRQGDPIRESLRERRHWISTVILTFVVLIYFYGDAILLLFGRPYLQSRPALLIILFGTSISVLFAPAPYMLQFMQRSRLVLITSAITCTITVIASLFLAREFGTAGVAIAYAIPLAFQYLFLKIFLHRLLP